MLPANIVEFILQQENNPVRFEKFCARLCEKVEGYPFLPTSVTYDRGRDARGIGTTRGSHKAILCATLNRELDEKLEKDLRRTSATTNPERLLYCSSQSLTEHKIDELGRLVRSYFNASLSLEIFGSIQIADLAVRHYDVFESFYGAEIQNIQETLRPRDEPAEEYKTRGLRLALLTFDSATGGMELRRQISRRAVLDTLHGSSGLTIDSLRKRLSEALRLPRPLGAIFLRQIAAGLAEAGDVEERDGVWNLTAKGRADVESVPGEAARSLLEGRTLIYARLQELTGNAFAPAEFDRIWSALLDSLSELFYSNGLGVIEGVRELIDPKAVTTNVEAPLRTLLKETASRVGATTTAPELRDTLEQAVLDIFTERSGAAFEWLAKVSERFVSLCSLGLESTSADEIRRIVRDELLVMDSDIVLTFLCPGEADHETAVELLKRWRRLGGRIVALSPILEEVAYHAWIAERDFDEVKSFAGRIAKVELRRYATNAFVRGFFSHSGVSIKSWNAYINDYRGDSSNDYSRILRILEDDLSIGRLSDNHDKSLKDRAAIRLEEMLAKARNISVSQLDSRDHDKARRDGQILATIAAARAAQREAGSNRTVLLISSSGRLRRAEELFRDDIRHPPAVISIGTFAFLLSLIPEAELGAGSLRRALFEFGEGARLTDVGRTALRIIRSTDRFGFAWSRRRTFQRQLQEVLHREAQQRDTPTRAIEDRFQRGDEGVRPAQLIAEALTHLPGSDLTSAELLDAQRTILSQQDQIEALEEQLRVLRRAHGTHD